ncbi:MAG: protein translocase subunit SecF [Candidatus Nealsonbacteria bacterium]|nr:protein translocase subunit SecF [Candidatus Nealsonbacteria bacterium]
MNFLRYKKIYFVFSGILIAGSIASAVMFGLNPGIDFTGGSILEVEYSEQRPSNQEIRKSLTGIDLGEISIQPSNDMGVIIRMKDISDDTHLSVIESLGKFGQVQEKRFESVGPVIGKELKEKTTTLIVLSLLSIVVYIILAFRKIRRPVPAWQYGIVSLIILFHDIIFPIGVFSYLGKFYGVQMTIPVIAALLTVVGYAINNVVVVFDRMRENLRNRESLTFEETINKGIGQTLTRCLNTSLTTLLPLFAIFFFGGATLRYFSLALIIGITAGTYSSILLAAPLLTIFKKHA